MTVLAAPTDSSSASTAACSASISFLSSARIKSCSFTSSVSIARTSYVRTSVSSTSILPCYSWLKFCFSSVSFWARSALVCLIISSLASKSLYSSLFCLFKAVMRRFFSISLFAATCVDHSSFFTWAAFFSIERSSLR